MGHCSCGMSCSALYRNTPVMAACCDCGDLKGMNSNSGPPLFVCVYVCMCVCVCVCVRCVCVSCCDSFLPLLAWAILRADYGVTNYLRCSQVPVGIWPCVGRSSLESWSRGASQATRDLPCWRWWYGCDH